MIRPISYSSCIVVYAVFVLFACETFSQMVVFDCPATAPAVVVNDVGAESKIIEVVLPVSTRLADSRWQLSEVRNEVSWHHNAFEVTDYRPHTTLQSKIDGSIAIEKKTEADLSIGAKLSTSHWDFFSPSITGNAGTKRSQAMRYNEVPQQQIAVASGTIKRATGAYFQFRPSVAQSLEGGRELAVAFRVPQSWRGGVLQVTCRAQGRRNNFAGFGDEFEDARAFVVPVYMRGDGQARQRAVEFAQSEQRLRRGWSYYQKLRAGESGLSFRRLLGGDELVSDAWLHHLIQAGSTSRLKRVESQLPDQVASAANQFISCPPESVGIGAVVVVFADESNDPKREGHRPCCPRQSHALGGGGQIWWHRDGSDPEVSYSRASQTRSPTSVVEKPIFPAD